MIKKNRGRFITLEGVEGVGKTSNISFIKSYLEKKNIELVLTREPGGTPMAEEIRQVFIKPREELVAENTELLLMFAARAQHIEGLIKPCLDSGGWVLSDRFTDASYAYQGFGRGLSVESIEMLETLVQKTLRPDLTILLDLPVAIGLERAKKRGEADRIESEDVAFFEKVRNGYLFRVENDPKRFAIVDASQSLEKVQSEIGSILDKFLQKEL